MARYYGREHFEALQYPTPLSDWPPWDYTADLYCQLNRFAGTLREAKVIRDRVLSAEEK